MTETTTLRAVSARPGPDCARPTLLAWLMCVGWFVLVTQATGGATAATVSVIDDSGRRVSLVAPAQRIISLAPHLTELLFAAGAGDRIVGTVEFSDYPASAAKITRIGDSALLDMERVVSLKPDLIVVWGNGSAASQLDKLRTLGVPIFYNEPQVMADIPRALIALGRLAGTEATANHAARLFGEGVDRLRARYGGKSPVSLFYQVWKQPLLTIAGRHVINDVIRACGGTNIFADLRVLVPTVSVEAVVALNPEAIVATTVEGQGDGLDIWRPFKDLRAVRADNLIVLNADTINRNTPRLLEGARALCEQLDAVRARRAR